MPTTCHRIARVLPTHYRTGVTRYEVLEQQTERPGRIFYAFDPWIASLCERAQITNQAVALTWRGTHYGELITEVRLLETGETSFERALQGDRV